MINCSQSIRSGSWEARERGKWQAAKRKSLPCLSQALDTLSDCSYAMSQKTSSQSKIQIKHFTLAHFKGPLRTPGEPGRSPSMVMLCQHGHTTSGHALRWRHHSQSPWIPLFPGQLRLTLQCCFCEGETSADVISPCV